MILEVANIYTWILGRGQILLPTGWGFLYSPSPPPCGILFAQLFLQKWGLPSFTESPQQIHRQGLEMVFLHEIWLKIGQIGLKIDQKGKNIWNAAKQGFGPKI